MPYPEPGESQQHYVSRFVSSPEAQASFPEKKQRLAVAYSMHKQRAVARHLRSHSSRNSSSDGSHVKHWSRTNPHTVSASGTAG
jgi:hypothetical protein